MQWGARDPAGSAPGLPTVQGARARGRGLQTSVRPGFQELPAILRQQGLLVSVSPLELPEEGLFVTFEVYQDGRQLGGARLKGLGAVREIPLRIRLDGARNGHPGLLRVRSNAELRLRL